MISVAKDEKNLIVIIDGEIDHHTSSEFKEVIDMEFSKKNLKNVIFDFKNVTFMDSSGIGLIIGRYKNAQKKMGQVIIYNVNDDLSRLIEISGLKKIIKIVSSRDEAFALTKSFN